MNGLELPRTHLRHVLSVCTALVLLGSVTSCAAPESAGEPDPRPGSKTPASAGSDTASEFCDSVDGIGKDLALIEMTEVEDRSQIPDRVTRAAERFASVEPPEEIAAAWQGLGTFFSTVAEALQGVEVTSEEDIEQALKFEGPEAFGMLIALPGQAETVGVHVQEACHVDLGITPPAIENVCDAVDPAHLGSVFGGAVPAGEHRPWGNGTVECMWDDGNDREVGIVVMPADAMRAEVLKDQSPQRTAQTDGVAIDEYDGAIGPLRAGPGSTAATVVGDTGVLASVAIDDTQAAALKAIALVGLVAADLG